MKYLVWIIGAILVALMLWGSLHMFVPTINPKQQAPKGHVQGPCWTCHIVTAKAKVKEVSQ